MRPISDKPIATLIQIEVTNACNRSCCNCVRFCGHFTEDKIFYADVDAVGKYLHALRDFPQYVCYIGGEPTLHPQFLELCYLMRQYRPRTRCGVFTNGLTAQYKEYQGAINDVFGLVNINNHKANISHTPVLVASGEMVPDEKQRMAYIDDCWLQTTWSANITPKGAYFCEVAGLMAWLFDGPAGWDATDETWWKKDVPDYREQIAWACHRCGAALPLLPRPSKEQTDDVSAGVLAELLRVKSPKACAGKYEIYKKGLFPQMEKKGREWYWNGERYTN